jgi:hypothetical protein
VAGSLDIRLAVEAAANELRAGGEDAQHWRTMLEAAVEEFAAVTTTTSRNEPGRALGELTRAIDLTDRLAVALDAARIEGDDYVTGV